MCAAAVYEFRDKYPECVYLWHYVTPQYHMSQLLCPVSCAKKKIAPLDNQHDYLARLPTHASLMIGTFNLISNRELAIVMEIFNMASW